MKYFAAVPYLLQICGLFPFSSRVVFSDSAAADVRYNGCFLLWSILGITVVLAEWIVGFSTNIYRGLHGLYFTIEIMKFITNTGSHLLSVVESWITRDRQQSIWKMNGKAAKLLNKSDETVQNACYRNIFYKFSIYLIVTLGIEIYYILVTRQDATSTNVWYVNIVSTTVCRIRYLQHVVYTTLLAFWFSNIKDNLKELARLCKSDGDSTTSSSSVGAVVPRLSPVLSAKAKRSKRRKPLPPPQVAAQQHPKTFSQSSGLIGTDSSEEDRRILHRLDILKEVYNMLFEVSEDLNSCFGIAQLANLLDNFVQLTCDFYWIYILLANNQLYHLVEEVLLILPTIAILTLLLSSCEKCLEEVRYIGFYINEIERDSANYDFELVVENFALQVLAERFEFNVAGFFSMSFNLLQEMFAAITTYMVILIQFTPSTTKTTEAEVQLGVDMQAVEDSVKKPST